MWPPVSETSGWMDVKELRDVLGARVGRIPRELARPLCSQEWEDWFTAQPLPARVAPLGS